MLQGPVYKLPKESVSDTDAIVRWMDIRSNPLVWRYSDGLRYLPIHIIQTFEKRPTHVKRAL